MPLQAIENHQQPLAFKEGTELLNKLAIIEFAIEAAISGDNGPLTSSPTQRRNMTILLADMAASFAVLAARIDPLGEEPEDKVIAWEVLRSAALMASDTATDPDKPVPYKLTDEAWEDALARAGD